MKKRTKLKTYRGSKSKVSKRSSKGSSAVENELPGLVTVMAKMVERLDSLEKKMDLVVSQTSVRPSETQSFFQNFHRPEPSHPHAPPHQPNQNQKGRTLYKAVCADCGADCEVPFKPAGSRPIYCKECYRERKSDSSTKADGGRSPVRDHTARMAVKHDVTRSLPHGSGEAISQEVAKRQEALRLERSIPDLPEASAVSSRKRKAPKPAKKSKKIAKKKKAKRK